MKDKILTLIIGILIGAVITAAGFLIYSKVSEDDTDMDRGQGGGMQMDGNFTGGGEAPDMQDGNFTPTDKPDDDGTAIDGDLEESNT